MSTSRRFRSTRFSARMAWLALAALVALPASAQDAGPSPVVVELGETTVSVGSESLGGRFVVFGFGHETRHFITRLIRREMILEDEDGDGVVTYDFGREIPRFTLWVGIDLETGEFGATWPESFLAEELELPAGAIAPTLGRLDLEMSMVEILVARKGVGAWGLRAGDAGVSDDDGELNDLIRVALDSMWSIGDSPPAPSQLQGRDVLVVLHPLQLRMAVVRPADAPGGGS